MLVTVQSVAVLFATCEYSMHTPVQSVTDMECAHQMTAHTWDGDGMQRTAATAHRNVEKQVLSVFRASSDDLAPLDEPPVGERCN